MNKFVLPFAMAAIVGAGSVQAANMTLSADIEETGATEGVEGQSTYVLRDQGGRETGVFNVELLVSEGTCPVDDNLAVFADLERDGGFIATCILDFRQFVEHSGGEGGRDRDSDDETAANYFLKVTTNEGRVREAFGECGGVFPELQAGDTISVEVYNGGLCGTAEGTYR